MNLSPQIQEKLDEFLPYHALLGLTLSTRQLKQMCAEWGAAFGAEVMVSLRKRVLVEGKPVPMIVPGEYDTGRRQFPILVKAEIQTPTPGKVTFTRASARLFRFLLSQTLQHELVHKMQFERNPKNFVYDIVLPYHANLLTPRKRQFTDYLGERRELDSYAHDMAMEIVQHYPRTAPLKVLKHIARHPKVKTWGVYVRAFEGTEWAGIQKHLLKRISRWLKVVQRVT